MQKRSMDDLNRISVEEFKQTEKIPLVVIMDNIRSMHNVGSIFRTSDAFLVNRIVLCGFTPRPPHRDINKTALGATETVTWYYKESTLDTVKELKAEGYKVYGIEQVDNGITLENFHFEKNEKIAIVLGNEVEGVNEEVLQQCNGSIEIPQFGTKHSLNVSVAGGILIWEIAKKYLLLKA
ncbi:MULTISPECIES: RNA methyltransferase [Chitinophagaceae]